MLKTMAKTLDSFLYHPATPESAKTHDMLRSTAITLARSWFDALPEGREKSLAFTKLEEALMWANKAIALMDPVAQEGTEDTARVLPIDKAPDGAPKVLQVHSTVLDEIADKPGYSLAKCMDEVCSFTWEGPTEILTLEEAAKRHHAEVNR